jgi:CRP-like cAMP-binding protein
MQPPHDRHRPAGSYLRRATKDDLRQSKLFDDVGEWALDKIVGDSEVYRLDAKEKFYPPDGEVEYLLVILSGYVAVWAPPQFTDADETFLSWRGPGQIIGEMRLLGNDHTHASVFTCEPCEFIEIRRDTLTDVADSSTLIYRNVARLLVKKMEHERFRSELIRMSPSIRQVAQVLLYLFHERRDDVPPARRGLMEIPGILHQEEIGDYIGVDRATVSRKLSKLKNADIITDVKIMRGSHITILDQERLEKVASGEITESELDVNDGQT